MTLATAIQNDARTTRRLKAAKLNSVFICNIHADIIFINNMLLGLNRTDITVVPRCKLTNAEYWLGRKFSEIVIDHHAHVHMSSEEHVGYNFAKHMIRRYE